MNGIISELHTISTLLDWHRQDKLHVNRDYQRAVVWTADSRGYLIDTILCKMPMPKMYFKSKFDTRTQTAVREIIDGQQRLTSIIQFAENRLRVSRRSKRFAGKRYSDLSDEEQTDFLSYQISLDQLLDPTMEDILEVFHRLNTYTVTLRGAEKRNAEFQGMFKETVRDLVLELRFFWDAIPVLSVGERTRMRDHDFVAEMLGIVLRGVADGDEKQIRKLYVDYNNPSDLAAQELEAAKRHVLEICREIALALGRELREKAVGRAPHVLMLFAAYAELTARYAIATERLLNQAEQSDGIRLLQSEVVKERLSLLNSALEDELASYQVPISGGFVSLESFRQASLGTLQRMKSRGVRMNAFRWVLTGP